MLKFLSYFLLFILVSILALFVWGKIYSYNEPLIVKHDRIADTSRIRSDLIFLTNECQFRNYQNLKALNKSADYIKSEFTKISESVVEQKFIVNYTEYKNIICSIGPENGERIIIGAHYDVCGDQDGADDNASGVSGLIELAGILRNVPLKYRIDFVAYSLEEPPFFKTKNMGSYVHAKSLYSKKIQVKGMICLEMIGYYSEKEYSQSYPIYFLHWFYGNKGNYITIVQKYGKSRFGDYICESMKKEQYIRTKSFSGPAWLAGVDFSDHLNYWKFGYKALMITNTAFYRNQNYHKQNDKIENLNIGNIGLVVDEVYNAIIKME